MTLTDLKSVITDYFGHKQTFDEWKVVCDKENKEIKDAMLELEQDEIDCDGIVAKRIVVTKESFNEAKLINLLENSTYTNPDSGIRNVCIATGLNIVKSKPYVDMDALEDAIYKGLIPEDVIVKMNDCKEIKETIQLRVSKKKKVTKNDD